MSDRIKKLGPDWYKARPIVIHADDAETIGLASGLIAAGEVIVQRGLSKAAARQGAALVQIALAEAREEATVAREEANKAEKKARAAQRRFGVATQPTGPPTAQQLVDRWATEGMPTPTRRTAPKKPNPAIPPSERRDLTPEERANPPKKVKRSDAIAVGKWAELIATGVVKVVD